MNQTVVILSSKLWFVIFLTATAANILSSVMTVKSFPSGQDKSRSLLSVHMGLQRKAPQTLDTMEMQEGSMATGGRCVTWVRIAGISC